MSPRKPSTSSGRPAASRPRYLALEVTGGQPLPPRLLEHLLRRLLADGAPGPVALRLIRSEGSRCLVELPHSAVGIARVRFNASLSDPSAPPTILATRRSYGTLLKGKRWLAEGRPGGGIGRRRPPRPRARTDPPRGGD